MGNKSYEFDREYWVEEDGLLLVRQWLEAGMTDKQVAKNIGVTPQTIVDWKKRYEKFCFVFKQARNVANQELENAMFKSATGYFVEEEALDRNGDIKVLKHYVAPAPQTQMWLSKNWMADKYKDKRDMNIEGALPVILSGEDELKD